MAAEGGAEVETQQKEETKRHTYPLVRVRNINLRFIGLLIETILDK